MTESSLEVACCFCGQSLPMANAIQLTIKPDRDLDEVQVIYSHAKCLDKVLDKTIPRTFEIT